jgi:hypothetical protein
LFGLASAAPPEQINYQGVLRDTAGVPLTGSYDITFRLYDAATSGNEILRDRHTLASGGQVAVSGGQFNVTIGSGTVEDGSGPGTYTLLSSVFGAYGNVYLELQVASETLAPRTPLASAPWALNATRLSGMPAGNFLDTSSTAQTKAGKLTLSGGPSPGTGGLALQVNQGNSAGAFTQEQISFGYGGSASAYSHSIRTRHHAGVTSENAFDFYLWTPADLSTSPGSFRALSLTPTGLGVGVSNPSYRLDVNQSQLGAPGAYVHNSVNVGLGNQSLSNAYLAFIDPNPDPFTNPYPVSTGGYFWTSDSNGFQSTWARVSDGFNGYGMQASGWRGGAYFEDSGPNPPAQAWIAATSQSGGHPWGVMAYGVNEPGNPGLGGGGGFFTNTYNNEYAKLATEGFGVKAVGGTTGGLFANFATGSQASVGSGIYKILGTGAVSFVQNHPDDPSKVVVYHAPESADVATFTRGSARLLGGEARVVLEPSFAWVTNPDIGVTAHVTPRGAGGLYVASVSTSELVVRALPDAPSELEFDYLIYGLRIGFEDSTSVQPKAFEAFIPSMNEHRALAAADPALASSTARSRFQGSGARLATGGRAADLLARVHEFDPAHDRIESSTTRSVADGGPTPSTTSARVSAAPSPRAPGVRQVVPVSEWVEPGDVLVVDPNLDTFYARGSIPADPTVVGIVAETEDGARDYSRQAPLADAGTVVFVRVDANYAPVSKGDLLCDSATPGYAMKSTDAAPGTIVAKALEALPAGTALIRALVMPR